MKIKEFAALNLKECLQQVRNEMGPEAVILETRKFKTGGIMGWGTKDAVKIVAATGVSVQDGPTAAASGKRQAASDGLLSTGGSVRAPSHSLAGGQAINPSSKQFDATTTPKESDDRFRQLERELGELRTGMNAIRQAVVAPPSAGAAPVSTVAPAAAPAAMAKETLLHPELYAKLRNAEVSEDLALELLGSLPDLSGWASQARAPLAEAALRDTMAKRIDTAGPIPMHAGTTRIVALIGPTGVGKTTTIAKLAANFALIEKKKVGLITMDTYRIAAVEQLKTYSQIIDIPIRVVYSQAEIGPALESFAGFDIVLIDTAGRSQKNLMQVSELKSLVETAGCETHLVLSASTKERDLLDQIARFRDAKVDRIVFTKLDETTTYGTLFTIAAQSKIPVSYLTTGQKVPEDIEPAEGERLASLVMNSV